MGFFRDDGYRHTIVLWTASLDGTIKYHGSTHYLSHRVLRSSLDTYLTIIIPQIFPTGFFS
jgi:hypothetical protein